MRGSVGEGGGASVTYLTTGWGCSSSYSAAGERAPPAGLSFSWRLNAAPQPNVPLQPPLPPPHVSAWLQRSSDFQPRISPSHQETTMAAFPRRPLNGGPPPSVSPKQGENV